MKKNISWFTFSLWQPPFWHTYSDMLEILTQFRGAGNHLPLSDPLLQLIHFSVELVEPVLLLQATLSFLHQVLEWHVQTVNLWLTSADELALKKKKKKKVEAINVLATVAQTWQSLLFVFRAINEITMCLLRSPVWMSHLQQLPALLWQQADGLGVVLDGLLKDQMLLQQLQRAWLVLVGKCDDKQRCLKSQ